jgi:hypothetical protein
MNKNSSKPAFPLDAKSIAILISGFVVMFIGFIIMNLDQEAFGFGFLGLTLGPILVLLGVIIPIFSLFRSRK